MNNNQLKNIILENIVRLFMKVMVIYSIYLLLRGHNNPGGGFIAGIIASTGFLFFAIIHGTEALQKIIKIQPQLLIATGLSLVFLAAFLPLTETKEFLTGLWLVADIPLLGEFHLGTPLLFDSGVFLVVIGVILTIVISIMEVLKWN
ncbi:MAG: MnhB domain-containing protein [Bacteroidales bacterium]|jgi:multisubunit Na+/H+ antiporter MnhB subunit|nr:MnhB domain-containing protein [Bacteroidales bacterium]